MKWWDNLGFIYCFNSPSHGIITQVFLDRSNIQSSEMMVKWRDTSESGSDAAKIALLDWERSEWCTSGTLSVSIIGISSVFCPCWKCTELRGRTFGDAGLLATPIQANSPFHKFPKCCEMVERFIQYASKEFCCRAIVLWVDLEVSHGYTNYILETAFFDLSRQTLHTYKEV